MDVLNEKSKKRKRITVVLILLAIVFVLPIVWLGASYGARLSKIREIEQYYLSDPERFGEISAYFKELYSEGLFRARLAGGRLCLEYRDGNRNISSDERDVSEERAWLALTELREKDSSDSAYPVFSWVWAFYDGEGDLLLYLCAHSEPIKGRDVMIERDIKKSYLVYIDEDYKGTDSWLGIDTYGVTEKPFSDRWYFWDESDYSG